MHSAMSDAIDEAKQCMTDNGPTLCVYGEVAPSLSETTALYESCYYTYLEHITQQIPLSKVGSSASTLIGWFLLVVQV